MVPRATEAISDVLEAVISCQDVRLPSLAAPGARGTCYQRLPCHTDVQVLQLYKVDQTFLSAYIQGNLLSGYGSGFHPVKQALHGPSTRFTENHLHCPGKLTFCGYTR